MSVRLRVVPTADDEGEIVPLRHGLDPRAALADAGCELVEQPVAQASALGRLVRTDPLSLVHFKKVLVTKAAIDKLKEMFA